MHHCPGLRRGRLGPAAHRGQAARHRLRAADPGAPTGTCSPRSPWSDNPVSHSNAGHVPPPADAGHDPARRPPRHRRRRRRWCVATSVGQTLTPAATGSGCSPSGSPSTGPQGVPVNRTARRPACHRRDGRRLDPAGRRDPALPDRPGGARRRWRTARPVSDLLRRGVERRQRTGAGCGCSTWSSGPAAMPAPGPGRVAGVSRVAFSQSA